MANINVHKPDPQGEGASTQIADLEERRNETRARAYDLFLRRGEDFGHDLEDWFAAEHELDGLSRAELTEIEGGCRIRVTLPGFDVRDVTVTSLPDTILIEAKAEAKAESGPGDHGKDEARVVWTEFASRNIFRSISLPKPADVDHVTGRLEKGVLTVDVPYAQPKAQAAKAPARKVATAA